MDLRDVKVVTKLGGTVDDSEMIDGMLFDHKPSKVLPRLPHPLAPAQCTSGSAGGGGGACWVQRAQGLPYRLECPSGLRIASLQEPRADSWCAWAKLIAGLLGLCCLTSRGPHPAQTLCCTCAGGWRSLPGGERQDSAHPVLRVPAQDGH